MPITKEFLLNDGRRMPWLGIGSGSAHHGRDASATIAGALRAGVVHLDTAQMYGNEDSVGAALADAGFRDKIWLTTKLDKLPPGESVLDALRASLARLRVDSVDLFLIHSPLAHDDIPATWRALEDAQRAGLARSIGVSNFRVHELETLLAHANVIPAVNQIEFHPYVLDTVEPLVVFCHAKGIVVESYSGLAPISRKPGGPVDVVLERVRARCEVDVGMPVSAAQILLKWVNQRGLVSITTTDKEERVREYLGAARLPDLTDAEMRAIEEAGRQLHYRAFKKHAPEEVICA